MRIVFRHGPLGVPGLGASRALSEGDLLQRYSLTIQDGERSFSGSQPDTQFSSCSALDPLAPVTWRISNWQHVCFSKPVKPRRVRALVTMLPTLLPRPANRQALRSSLFLQARPQTSVPKNINPMEAGSGTGVARKPFTFAPSE